MPMPLSPEQPPAPAGPAPEKPAQIGLYDLALTEAERLHLDQARKTEGFDEEVAVLRVRLRSLMEKRPKGDVKLLMQAIALLIKATAVKHRLSPAAADSISQALINFAALLGDVLIPEDARG
jgi:hypothetical protein